MLPIRGVAVLVAILLFTVAAAQSLASAQDRPATIVGQVGTIDDTGVADVKVDLFETAEGGGPGLFIGTTRTRATGQFEFDVPGLPYPDRHLAR